MIAVGGRRPSVGRLAFEARLARRQLGEPALVGGPDARSAPLHRRVGIGEAGKVGGERIGALGLGQVADEISVEIGAENSRTVDEGPLDLLALCRERPRAARVPARGRGVFGVGERERRAPRAADEEPTLDTEMLADALEIGDEVLRRVGARARDTDGCARRRADRTETRGSASDRTARGAGAASRCPVRRAGTAPECRRRVPTSST